MDVRAGLVSEMCCGSLIMWMCITYMYAGVRCVFVVWYDSKWELEWCNEW